MKNKINFTVLLLVLIAALIFGCNRSTNKPLSGEDVNLESAKLKTIGEQIDLKIKNIYDSIDYISESYENLVGDLKTISNGIKERTDELINYLQDLKIEIVTTVEGPDSPAISGRDINTANFTKLQNTKIPSKILIGNNNNGRAFLLKALLNDYKEYLIKIVMDDSLSTKNIGSALNTDDQKKMLPGKSTEEIVTWELSTFQAQPLGSVTIILTQIQNSVKNSESEVLSYIKNKMDAIIKLDKGEPLKK
jgi:hypothetical protein